MIKIEDSYYLEHDDQIVRIDETDVYRLKIMTPQGRKVYFRQKGKEIRLELPEDPSAALLIQWFKIPASEWAFDVENLVLG